MVNFVIFYQIHFLKFLRDPEGDFLKAENLFYLFSKLVKESSPLISALFKFFSFLIKIFTNKFFLLFFFIFLIVALFLFFVTYLKNKKKKIIRI